MAFNNSPNLDPANLGSLIGAFREIFNRFTMQSDGMLPAKVTAFKAGPPALVQVQPMIKVVGTSGEQISRAQIAEVPVVQIGGGGFIISVPLKPGDLGWIIANDRDISLYMQSLKETAPNTYRVKSFSDAIFIPSALTGYSAPSDVVSIQSLDGTVQITLSTDTIMVTAPNVIINSPTATVTGALGIEGGITSSGGAGPNNALFTGDLRVVGNITASGDITAHVP